MTPTLLLISSEFDSSFTVRAWSDTRVYRIYVKVIGGEKWEIPDRTPWLQTSSRLNGNRETVKMAVKQKETGATL